MKVTDQILANCEAGTKTATRHIETAQGFYQDAHDQGNMVAVDHAKEAIDFADLAVASYQDAITQVGRGENGIDALERGLGQLRQCEKMLSKAEASLKSSEGKR